MRLILMRHPPVTGGAGRCYGRLDLPADADAIPASLAALAPWSGLPVYASPALRCRQLAGAFSNDVSLWAELQELDFGDWEGRFWDDIERAELDRWAADIWHYRPGNGESAAMLLARWRFAVARWQEAGLEQAVVITHAGIIRTALAETGLLGGNERWNTPIPHAQAYELNLQKVHTNK